MNLEAKAMKIVEDVLGVDQNVDILGEGENMNGFCFGTLFVCCFPADAKKLLKKLNSEFDGKVQMTKQTGHMEYSYDFVA